MGNLVGYYPKTVDNDLISDNNSCCTAENINDSIVNLENRSININSTLNKINENNLLENQHIMEPKYPLVNNFNRENWMSELSNQILEKRLIDLRIPGTYNSSSYSCNLECAMHQNTDIYSQLKRGVRFINLHLGKKFSEKSDCVRAGNTEFSWGTKLESIVKDIKRFVLDHPKEFIIIKNTRTAYLEDEDKKFITDLFSSELNEWLVKKKDDFNLKTVKIQDLWFKNKRVWIFNDNFNNILNVSEERGEEIGLWPSSYLSGELANTIKINNLFNFVEDEFNKCNNLPTIHISHLILTPELLRAAEVGIQNITKDLQIPNFSIKWFKDMNKKYSRINVICLDFIFGINEHASFEQLKFIDYIINSNSDKFCYSQKKFTLLKGFNLTGDHLYKDKSISYELAMKSLEALNIPEVCLVWDSKNKSFCLKNIISNSKFELDEDKIIILPSINRNYLSDNKKDINNNESMKLCILEGYDFINYDGELSINTCVDKKDAEKLARLYCKGKYCMVWNGDLGIISKRNILLSGYLVKDPNKIVYIGSNINLKN